MKKFITKENLLYLTLFLTSINVLAWFYKKYIIGSRDVFWDLAVNYCAGKVYSSGYSPYGFLANNPIAKCINEVAGLNEAFAYVYTIPLVKFFSLFSFFNFTDLKKIWFFVIIICTLFIFKNTKELFAEKKNNFFFLIILFFSSGGIFFQSLINGNISIIGFTLISFSLLSLYKNEIKKFVLFILIASLIKPHFFFYILIAFIYKGMGFFKTFFYSSILISLVYFSDFIFNKELFLEFFNSMKTIKSDLWFFSFGGGIGLVSINEQLPSRILSFFNIYVPSGPSIFSLLFWIFCSSIILMGTTYLFSIKKYWRLSKKKLFFTYSFLLVTMCMPRISFYELYLLIPAMFYISNLFFYSKNKFTSNLGFILLFIMFGIHDINAIFFQLSFIIFLLIFINNKKLDIKI